MGTRHNGNMFFQQLRKLLARLTEQMRSSFIDKLTQTIEEQYYGLGKPLAIVISPHFLMLQTNLPGSQETLFLLAFA